MHLVKGMVLVCGLNLAMNTRFVAVTPNVWGGWELSKLF